MEQVTPLLTLYGPDLVGVLLPPVIEIVNKNLPEDASTKKFLSAMAICFMAALLLKWNSLMAGSLDQLLASFGLIFTESQVVYRLYFKDSFIKVKINEKFVPTPQKEPLG